MALVKQKYNAHNNGAPSHTASLSVTDEDFYEEFCEEEEGGKRKIMSVELALQRESAYKQKMARLGLGHRHDNVNVPVQVPPLSQSVGANRTPPSGNIINIPPFNLSVGANRTPPSGNIINIPPNKLSVGANRTLASGNSINIPPVSVSAGANRTPPSGNAVNVPPVSLPVGENRTPPSRNVINIPPTQLQLSHIEKTPRVQPSENTSCSSSLQHQQSFTRNTSQIHPSKHLSHLPPRSRLQLPVPQNPLQIQPSENLSRITPPSHLPLSISDVPHQNQSSQNLSHIPLQHLHQSVSAKPVKLRPSETLSREQPPVQLQQSLPNRMIQTHQSLNIWQSPPPLPQQPCAKKILPIQPSESPSYVPPTQMHQAYIKPALFSQSHMPCIRPTQLQKYHAKRTFQFQPISLVCKECQVPCSSVVTLKKHYRGRKHRARVEELKAQNNTIQVLDIQDAGIEPLWCNICKIRCMNEEAFQQHLQGKKHASCIQAINSVIQH